MIVMRTGSRGSQLFSIRDFTGGLNLTTDTFKLAENESPDVQNVDFDRRGGFQIRRGVAPFSTTTLGGIAPNAIWVYNYLGTVYTLVQIGANIYQGTGTSWTVIGSGLGSVTQAVQAVTFNNNSYWVRGDADVVRSVGLTATTMGVAFNNTTTPSVPPIANVPRAEHIAVHSGYMWVANTWESGTNYPNRVRWSWANTFDNSGENWDVDDYIDIDDGKDSDEITAIVPHGDQLIVFKRNAIYVVYGYDGPSFTVTNISNTVGAVSRAATADTPAGLFFFDHANGINVYDRGSIKSLFTQIEPALRDGDIPKNLLDNVQIAWVNNRLWVSVPWANEPTIPRGMTFVLDPSLKSGGSYTRYSLQIDAQNAGGFGPYATGGRTEEYLAYIHGTNRVFKLDVNDQYYDNFSGTLGIVTIDAYYRTRWVDLNEPAIKKRWRRTEVLMQVDQGYDLPVVSYSDYDPTISIKNFVWRSLASTSTANEGIWDNPAISALNKWDTATWAKSGVYGYVDRGSTLGIARSVSLKIGGKVLTTPNPPAVQAAVFWGVDALIFKYVPRRIR